MPTNGMLLSAERRKSLLEVFPDYLTISIDGATRESFESIRVRAKFDKVVGNVAKLVAARGKSKSRNGQLAVLCALQKDNLFDFDAMYRLVHEVLKPDEFNLVPVFDYDSQGDRYGNIIPSLQDIDELRRRIDERLDESMDPKKRQFFEMWKNTATSLAPEPGRADALEASGHACVIPWFSSYIDAKGRVYPCCYLLTSKHVMGNINESAFQSIWYGTEYKRFRLALASDRRNLAGCDTCRLNYDGLVDKVRRYRSLLPRAHAE
jgi:radical SAM protein with 4Fe4S-binding SPASM domain